MGAERGRYFLAVTLPEAQRENLSKLQDSGRGFSWTKKENLHLTLRFIGDVETERIERLIELLKEIDVVRFILPLEGVGTFPSRGRARVIWAGVGNGHPRLFQLRQRVDDTLLRAGIDADLKHFHPHVTISRIREDARQSSVLEWLKRWSDYRGPPFRIESVDLYQSFLYHMQKRMIKWRRSRGLGARRLAPERAGARWGQTTQPQAPWAPSADAAQAGGRGVAQSHPTRCVASDWPPCAAPA